MATSVSLPTFLGDGSVDQLKLDESSAPETISEGLLIHKEDADRQMTEGELERILSLPRSAWQSGADPSTRASHFMPTTMWMLGVVENMTAQRLDRWLVLRPWRLWDVRLFAVDADTGELLASYEVGHRVPMTERVLQTPEAAVPLTLAAAQRVLLVLRIQDKTFPVVTAQLREPDVHMAEAQRVHDLSVALLGFILAIVLVLLVQGDWRYAVVALWLAGTAMAELTYLVPLLPALFPALTPHAIAVFTASAALGWGAFAVITLAFLELYRNRFWLVVYGSCIAVLVVCSLVIPWVREHQIVRMVMGVTMLFILCSWPLAVWSGRRVWTRPYGRTLMLLLVLYWVFATWRMTMITGVLHLEVENDPRVVLYLFGLVVVALGIVGMDGRNRRDLALRLQRELVEREEAEKQRILAMQREENIRLAAEVARQTEALRKANAQAMASSAAKSKFLSSASHELRAPLHDLLGYAQLLSREISAEAQAHLAVIQKSGNQLLHLIDDILEFSRSEAKPIVLERAPISLPGLAAHLAATCAPVAARSGNRFCTRVELGSMDWVIADERRLTQVLRNLIDNACKYTRDGDIELAIESADGVDKVGESQVADAPLVRFSVRDTGVGIPPDRQEAIFEPFQRLDRYDRAPGLGLGLTISQQILTAMGGSIHVQSRQGRDSGSLFSFELRLPKTEAGGAVGGPSQRAILGYQGRPRTILIVDDRPSSRRLLAERCEFLGLEVLEATNGVHALALLSASETRPDLALVDQFMPELDGWGFLRRVRASDRDRALPVVLISAAPPEPPDGFPDDLAFDEVALKPLSAPALTDILQRHLGLIWEYAGSDPEGSDIASASQPAFEPDSLPTGCCDLELAQLNEMLSLGAVVAIERWAIEMAEAHPAYARVWDEIRRRADSVDLVGLRNLYEQLRAEASEAASSASD